MSKLLCATLFGLGSAWLAWLPLPALAQTYNVKVIVAEHCWTEARIKARPMAGVDVKFTSRTTNVIRTSGADGRALFQLGRGTYDISANAPPNSYATLELVGVDGGRADPHPDTKAVQNFAVDRDVEMNVYMVRRRCADASAAPPPVAPTVPKPPAVAQGPACGQALLTEHARLLEARSWLRAVTMVHLQNRPIDEAGREDLKRGIDQLARAAQQALGTLQAVGHGLDNALLQPFARQIEQAVVASVSQSAKDKLRNADLSGAVMDLAEGWDLKDKVRQAGQERQRMQQEWGNEFQRLASAAGALQQVLPATSEQFANRFQDQVSQLDLRLSRLRGIAGEARCALPPDSSPLPTPNSQAVVLGLQPPLDFAGGQRTDPRVTNNEDTAILYKTGEVLSMSGEPMAAALLGGGGDERATGTVLRTSLRAGAPARVVMTPEARITPDGTTYLAHRDVKRAFTFVYVLNGSVSVAPIRGPVVRLGAGQAALATNQGVVPLRADLGRPTGTTAPINPLFEIDTNRGGSDYASFDLPGADPQHCFDRCKGDNRCRAWTYVKPGVQGPLARCYLKTPAPQPSANTCCISGVFERFVDKSVQFEVNVNRLGSDFASFDLPVADPQMCFDRCKGDSRCAAWTFVRPGVQGPGARCYLKNPAPAPTPNNCCISGAMTGASTAPMPPAQLPGGDVRYDNPAVNGVLIDHCASWATNCGQGGADQFCRRQGHGAARSFQVRNPGRTYVLGDNRVCEGGTCVGFSQVVCAGAGQVTPPPPVTASPTPPPSASDGNCWARSPTFIEQVDSGWQGVYTRRGGSNVFDVTYSRAGQIDRGELTLELVGATAIRINRYRSGSGYTVVLDATIGADGLARGSYPGGDRFTVRCTGTAQSQDYRVPPPPPTPPRVSTPPPQAAATPPQPQAQAARYLGCFRDPNNPFDLDGHLERSAQNSPQRCIQICAAKGFKHAGVQYGESCLCGNSYGKFGPANNCNMRCTGDANQVCGGASANNVYSTGR